MADRPISRKKNVTEGGAGVHKRGEGLGTGPVGSGHVPSTGGSSGGSDGNVTRGGGKGSLLFVIIAIVVLLGGGGGIISPIGA